jgi:hypothetical protein
VITVIGAAVGILAIVGAVNKAPARLTSETLQRGLGQEDSFVSGHEALEDADDILKTAIVFDGSGRFGTTVGVTMLLPPTLRQADAHGLAGRTPMDSADLRKPDMRTEGLMTQLVKFVVGQVLDVPLYV